MGFFFEGQQETETTSRLCQSFAEQLGGRKVSPVGKMMLLTKTEKRIVFSEDVTIGNCCWGKLLEKVVCKSTVVLLRERGVEHFMGKYENKKVLLGCR